MANVDDLATILTSEMGKPFAEAKAEILHGAGYIEWYSEEAKRIYGATIPGHQRDKRIVVLKQPIGVVGAVTPWNFPNAMVTRKAGPALAVGCSIVLRPSALTPLSALALAELAERAGLPRGVFNVVTAWTPKRSARLYACVLRQGGLISASSDKFFPRTIRVSSAREQPRQGTLYHPQHAGGYFGAWQNHAFQQVRE